MSYARPAKRSRHYGRTVSSRARIVVPRPIRQRARPVGRARLGGYYGRMGVGGTEQKFFDTNVTGTALGVAGTVLSPSLNLVDTGNGESDVIGRKMTITSIFIRGIFFIPTITAASIASIQGSEVYRMALCLDKQANGGAGTIALMYQDTAITTFNNLENSQRFTVLKEWKGNLNRTINHDGTNYFTGDTERGFKWYKKCNLPIEFGVQAGGSRVIGEVRSNNLVMFGFSSVGQAQVLFRVRIRFSDS